MPKISVVVPVYNVEKILKFCVDSILAQSFSDLEVLLIDDGSTDESPSICDYYKNLDNRIKVFHKKNGGLSDARNFGIENASGDNFLFIDSDDVLHKDFCKVLIELQNKYEADITSTDLVEFFEFSEIEILNNRRYVSQEYVFSKEEILREYYCPTGKTKIYHGLCMKLYKKELFKELRFEKGRLHEDLYITYQLLDRSNRFVYVDLPYYYYYQKNVNSITKNYKTKNLLDEYDAIQNMLLYFDKKENVENYLKLFVINHYRYLYCKSFKLPDSDDVLEKRSLIKKWIVSNRKNLPLIKRFLFLGTIYFHKIYSRIKGY